MKRYLGSMGAACLAGLVAGGAWAQDSGTSAIRDARDLALKLTARVEPRAAYRYAQGPGIQPGPVRGFLEHRRAFVPGERVRLVFRLPERTTTVAPLVLKTETTLSRIDGREVQQVGALAVRAQGTHVGGALDWQVPDLPEGECFLTTRFTDADDQPLATRSDIVFLAPEYPALLAAARDAMDSTRRKLGGTTDPLAAIALASTEMRLEDARSRFEDFGEKTRDWAFVKRELQGARADAEALVSGIDPYRTRTGQMVKAYRSELDGTLQPYALYVPRHYDPQRAYPLLVSLHGATSTHRINLRRVFGFGNRPGESDYDATRNEIDLPDVDFIVACPYGRGEVAGYSGLGENDVLRVPADVRRAYNVDADRVFLTGLSMGGGGTWHLGLRYPDLFAAIVPVCPVTDPTLFRRAADFTDYDRRLLALTSPVELAENAEHLRVFIYQGDADETVVPEQVRRMMERFRALGFAGRNVEYHELPGVNHFAWDFAYRDGNLFRLLAPLSRVSHPEHIVYVTHSARYGKSYWLRIDALTKGLTLARIEGRRQDEAFTIQTSNVSAFSLLLDESGVVAGRPLTVTVGGRRVFSGVPKARELSFVARGGRFALRTDRRPLPQPPDHAEGGLRARNLVQSGPQLYVYGTLGGEALTRATRSLAENLADWGPGVKVAWKVVADTDVTPEDLATRNLILVGGAKTNALVARMARELPLKALAAGDADGSYRLIHPNPFRPDAPRPLAPASKLEDLPTQMRLILVYGAETEKGLANLASLDDRNWFPNRNADYLVLDGGGKITKAGLFADDWIVR